VGVGQRATRFDLPITGSTQIQNPQVNGKGGEVTINSATRRRPTGAAVDMDRIATGIVGAPATTDTLVYGLRGCEVRSALRPQWV